MPISSVCRREYPNPGPARNCTPPELLLLTIGIVQVELLKGKKYFEVNSNCVARCPDCGIKYAGKWD